MLQKGTQQIVTKLTEQPSVLSEFTDLYSFTLGYAGIPTDHPKLGPPLCLLLPRWRLLGSHRHNSEQNSEAVELPYQQHWWLLLSVAARYETTQGLLLVRVCRQGGHKDPFVAAPSENSVWTSAHPKAWISNPPWTFLQASCSCRKTIQEKYFPRPYHHYYHLLFSQPKPSTPTQLLLRAYSASLPNPPCISSYLPLINHLWKESALQAYLPAVTCFKMQWWQLNESCLSLMSNNHGRAFLFYGTRAIKIHWIKKSLKRKKSRRT